MRVWHKGGYSFVQGKVTEKDKILEWVKLANCEVIVDECDDDETSFTVVSNSPYTTQKERQEDFKMAKNKIRGANEVNKT